MMESNKDKQTGKLVKFESESIILQEGEADFNMYKIVRGHVELYTGYGTKQEVLLGLLGPSSCFGEFGILLHKEAIYTAVAYSDVYCLRVTEGEIDKFMTENHVVMLDIMRNMAKTMVVMQKQIDMLAGELNETGEKSSISIADLKRQSSRNIRGYAIYNPNNPGNYFSL
ncbi:MAG: cyclic nucleotide-binding domain-containing protein [Lachnospiraceae bacterium]|nr:cyclic nucleotide-binding domain-containing protein [Lachnospiraceae bacterium]